ncbi:uncharacterized protein LOC109844172 [Asparagus officinalis]|uniref:uncharacterized protein LOC109844172 n=1 Tax=Asparagus officinalis TaxID=4686 RepID=UPI00098E2EED|nr:uncharacterized protein LOC109844172 [Asparagus officinalis]
MGNCMETCIMRQENRDGKGEDVVNKEVGLSVKILLTKRELEWLMLSLKEKGGRNLEDVLMESGREREREARGRNQGWEPSLESIIEIPEAQSFDYNEDL